MELYSVFITGANRGIGLGLLRHLIQLPKPPKYVFATYRSANGIEDLTSIRDKSKNSKILLIKMDVTKKSDIETARKIVDDVVGDRGLTLLINNAGVLASQDLAQITEENLLYHFKTNTIGPMIIVQEFLSLLKKAAALRGSNPCMEVSRAAVLNISSIAGSISKANDLAYANATVSSYCISKAGLNMAMRIIAADLKKENILVTMMCPGPVKTDMNPIYAKLEVDESVSDILKTLATLNETQHGSFIDRHGYPYKF